MKTISVKPAPKICIKLKDKKYICSFNMLMMAYMQESFSELGDISLAQVSPSRMASLILYAGIKANDESFTLEEATALAMEMGPGNYGDIIATFNEAYLDSLNEKEREEVKKKMALMIAPVLK